MAAKTRTLLAWSLWLAALLWVRPLTAGLLVGGAGAALAFPLGYASVGLVLGLRRPGNPIGWLYGASGLVWALTIPFEPWLDPLLRDHRPLALAGQLAVVVRETSWALAIALGLTLPFLLLPNGRLRSRRSRLVVADTVVGVVLLVVGRGLAPGPLTGGPVPVDNPFGLGGVAGELAAAVVIPGLVLYAVSLPAALVGLVLRFRASGGVERQQLRWVAAGAIVAVIWLVPKPGVERLPGFLTEVAVLAVPVSVAVAVLRYRLWDLDRLVSRTVTYALVTALLVVPYLLILPAATRLAGNSGSLAVAALTLAAAAVFAPLRRRVQDLVDRRFNRRRYDTARTVERFAVRLRDQLDLDALEAELLGVVDQTVAPTRASLWLRPPTSPRLPTRGVSPGLPTAFGLNPIPKALMDLGIGLRAIRVGLRVGIGAVSHRPGRAEWLEGVDMTQPAPPSPQRPGRAILRGLLDVRPSLGIEHERAAVAAADAVAQGLAAAKVYAFASVDYPGAAQSLVFDSDATTAVGAFVFDPGSATSPTTAFRFTGGVYQILTVPSSTTSIATGINGAGLIVGVYQDLSGVRHGFTNNGGTFSNVDFPGASGTQAIGVNDAGQIVGDYFDAANVEHGFLNNGGTFTAINFPGATRTAAAGINATGDIVGVWSDATGSHGFLLQAGVFTPIDFPLATNTSAFGITDTGEIAGFYDDAAGTTHGFIYASGAFSTVDVAGARGTLLTRIKNAGSVTGVCTDALAGQHGLTGQ